MHPFNNTVNNETFCFDFWSLFHGLAGANIVALFLRSHGLRRLGESEKKTHAKSVYRESRTLNFFFSWTTGLPVLIAKNRQKEIIQFELSLKV